MYGEPSVHQARAEIDIWYPPPGYYWEEGWYWVGSWAPEFDLHSYGVAVVVYDGPPNWLLMGGKVFSEEPDGIYQMIAVEYNVFTGDPNIPIPYTAIDVYEIVIDID